MDKLRKHFSELWYMYVLGALIVLVTIFYGRIAAYEAENQDEINAVYHMTEFQSSDITEISYLNRMGKVISFIKKEDGTWIYKDDPELAIEQAGPQYLVELVRNITTEYLVEDAEDISIYGLSEKSPYIEFKALGDTYKMYIGNYNDTVKRYYANMAGSKDVYGIKINIAEILEFNLKDYILEEE